MDPDDLALLNQWLAGQNPNGVRPPPTGSGPWANPTDQTGLSQPSFNAASGVQSAAGSTQSPLVWPDFQDGSAAAISPQDYADALQTLIGRSGGGAGGAVGSPVGYEATQTAHVVPTAGDIIGTDDSDPRLSAWRSAYDQAHGASVSPWRQDAPLQFPPDSASNVAPPVPTVLGPHRYMPLPGDENTLARIIYAEGASTPDDFAALGWSAVNRVGVPKFGQTLGDVISKPAAFSSVEGQGSALWRETSDPSKLTGVKAERFRQAQQTAKGILSGSIVDPTGGASYFFASPDMSGNARTAARGQFSKGLANGAYDPAPYQGHAGVTDKFGHLQRNYFLIDRQ